MKIGLALSGGGWRATLYHLGVVRFLRDSDLLAQVSHITSVSGGSVLAAHLALNWDRYCGEPSDFDAAAKEILKFVSLDVRNRIVRRYPGILAYGLFRRLTFRRNARLYSRIGLLEWHYRQHLVGDACLHELPTNPEFHFLSTDVSEGGFSSFTHGRLLIQERTGDGRTHVKPYRAGLAKVATAIAASSAFPAFFPPLELRADDIGATEGEFPTQYLTDGGVFDNLGLRVFHYLERVRRPELTADDFVDPAAAEAAWQKASNEDERSALRREAELANASLKSYSDASTGATASDMLAELNALLLKHRRVDDPELLALLPSGNAQSRQAISGDRSRDRTAIDTREAIATAFGQAIGSESLRDAGPLCDVVLASDAGKEFAVYGAQRSPGFFSPRRCGRRT